ncbi:hypothetical protein LTR86_000033 [Recurvomyces mirabilis]|nr:hypothetical protein LTR86_000033 [Recurvomyces mirabilis]
MAGWMSAWLGIRDTVQLIHTDQHRPSCAYVALSHCWGGKIGLLNLTTSEPELLEGMQWAQLPNTFQDAITATRQIRMHYLWIDSLCIQQDDWADWAQHAECMDKVFQHAQVTIAATSSANSSTCFIGPDTVSARKQWQAVKIEVNIPGWPAEIKASRYSPSLSPGWPADGPLELRAWAWQERHLSKRIISFADDEMKWHCNTGDACECSPAIHAPNENNSSWAVIRKERTALRWREVVSDYSPRHLSFPSDKLPAIAGAASRFAETLESEYLAGLWKSDFPRCLAWKVPGGSDCPTDPQKMRCSMPNCAPSWSWASIDVHVEWHHSSQFDASGKLISVDPAIHDSARLVGYDCQPCTANRFGDVRPGSWLEVEGKIIDAQLEYDIRGCACVRRPNMSPQLVMIDCLLVAAVSRKEEQSPAPTTRDAGDDTMRDSSTCRASAASPRRIRRALYHEYEPSIDTARRCAHVLCLLLYTELWDGKKYPYILVLSETTGGCHQRVGIGIGHDESEQRNTGFDGRLGSLYRARKDKFDRWRGWETLSEWHDWEKWFAVAETRTVRIV